MPTKEATASSVCQEQKQLVKKEKLKRSGDKESNSQPRSTEQTSRKQSRSHCKYVENDATISKSKTHKHKRKSTKKSHATDFLRTLEIVNQSRKQGKNQQPNKPSPAVSNDKRTMTPTSKPKKQERTKPERKLTKKWSSSRQKIVLEQFEKTRALTRERRRNLRKDYVDDAAIPHVAWFNMTPSLIEDGKSASFLEYSHDDGTIKNDKENAKLVPKPKPKKGKQLRSTAEYSHQNYNFATTKLHLEQNTSYYLHTISLKRRHFSISNLVTKSNNATVARLWGIPNGLYRFDTILLQKILNKKDKWYDQTRLTQYMDRDKLTCHEDDKSGMEVLSVFFGPNAIDDGDKNDADDDNISLFSIVSVESIVFSDDSLQEWDKPFQGKAREKVEVIPGQMTILRSEEETYHAISTGNYMSSLCLGCGTALVSVQDAREVACPSCRAITPLNGISLAKPFGITTGVQRSKCENLLMPRKSPFVRAVIKDDCNESDGNSEMRQNAAPIVPSKINLQEKWRLKAANRQGKSRTNQSLPVTKASSTCQTSRRHESSSKQRTVQLYTKSNKASATRSQQQNRMMKCRSKSATGEQEKRGKPRSDGAVLPNAVLATSS